MSLSPFTKRWAAARRLSENVVVGLAEAIITGIASTAVSESSRLTADPHQIITGRKLILREQDNVYAYDIKSR